MDLKDVPLCERGTPFRSRERGTTFRSRLTPHLPRRRGKTASTLATASSTEVAAPHSASAASLGGEPSASSSSRRVARVGSGLRLGLRVTLTLTLALTLTRRVARFRKGRRRAE